MSGNMFIVSGPKHNTSIPDESVGKYIMDNLRQRNKDDPISIDALTKEVQTCGNLLEDAIKTVQLFKKFGVKKDDVVSIICENTIYFNVPMLATWCMGVITNPLNPDYTIGELRHALLISKPKIVLCSSSAFEKINKLREEFKFLKEIFLFGDDVSNLENTPVPNFKSLLKNVEINQHSFEFEQFDATKTGCLIMLSSGTTGLPKGVLLTHTNLRNFFEVFPDPRYCGLTQNDTVLGLLPLFHIFGLLVYISTLISAPKIIMLKKFKPDLFLSTIQDYKVNKLHVVPPMVLFLAKNALVEKYDLSSIEDILCGASALGNETKEEVTKRIGKISFRQVYGSTETTGACMFIPHGLDKGSSIGKLMPEIQAKVWNLSTHQNVGPGKTGELCFRGPIIMPGYVGMPNDFTVIDEDGFYHSGDIGYYDEEGFFYIVDRIKELIKYKGFQVSPVELEVLLLTHPAIKECGVIGKPDERAGQVPLAFVVRQPHATVTEQELVDYVAERISSNKRLYGGVQFIEEIPKNSSGKVLRRKLAELL